MQIKNQFKILFVFCLLIISKVYAVEVYFSPMYTDKRFPPSDKLHAGCTHTAEIGLKLDNEELSTVNLVFKYNPKEIQIVRVLPTESSKDATYSIEYDKITFNKVGLQEYKNINPSLLTILFKSNENILESDFFITQGSYVTSKLGKITTLNKNFKVQFSKAIECDPDIVPPKIELIKPKNNSNNVPLDSSFIFDIKDDGKGIDKKSLKIDIDGEEYGYNYKDLIWEGSSVKIYPRYWLNVNKKIKIHVFVSDQQSYGGANVKEENFEIKTSEGLLLENPIEPGDIREISQSLKNTNINKRECSILGNIYLESNDLYKKHIKSIIEKIGCEIPEGEQNIVKKDTNKIESKKLSILGIMGRILFIIILPLKLHYLYQYIIHKKKLEKATKN